MKEAWLQSVGGDKGRDKLSGVHPKSALTFGGRQSSVAAIVIPTMKGRIY